MKMIRLDQDTEQYNKQAAEILKQAFPHSYGDCADREIFKCVQPERVAIAAVEGDILLGFVGAIPSYGVTAWELHPLVVSEDCRSKGVGTKLCTELEYILREKGCLTVYLGSDDENNSTTLSSSDLFQDTYRKIETIQNIKQHPYEFYQKVGYKIVGVIPDANGIGKPDIWLAKSIY